jgi:nonribosomal peptide synthetase CepA
VLAGLALHGTEPTGGGHTPSDFPLVDLDQDELDEFEAAANQLDELEAAANQIDEGA